MGYVGHNVLFVFLRGFRSGFTGRCREDLNAHLIYVRRYRDIFSPKILRPILHLGMFYILLYILARIIHFISR